MSQDSLSRSPSYSPIAHADTLQALVEHLFFHSEKSSRVKINPKISVNFLRVPLLSVSLGEHPEPQTESFLKKQILMHSQDVV